MTPTARREAPAAEPRDLLWPVLAGALCLGVIGLDRSPITWIDEVFYVDPARALAATGSLTSPIFAGVRGLDRHFFLQPPVSFFARALVFLFFGFGKWQARLPGLLEYAACIALVYELVSRAARPTSARRWLAAGAALLYACDAGVIQSARSGRPDQLAAGLLLGSALLLVHDLASSRGRTSARFWAGLLAGLASMTHASLLAVLPGALAASALGAATPRQRLRWAVACSFGCSLPLAGWGIQILQLPEVWREQFLAHAQATALGAGHIDRLAGLLEQLRYFRASPLILMGMLAVFVLGARRLQGPARILGVYALSSCLLVFSQEAFFALTVGLFYSAALLGLDALLASGALRLQTRPARVAIVLMVLSCVPIPLIRCGTVLAQWSARSEEPVRALVREHVPKGASIAGVAQGYFAAAENGNPYYYLDPLSGLRIPATQADVAVFASAMARLRPQYVLSEGGHPTVHVEGLPAGSIYEKIAEYHSPAPRLQFLRGNLYSVTLWKIDYPADRERREPR